MFWFLCIQVEVEEGSLVCPESGKKFPIKNGIPNMLLNEDEVWFCPKLELNSRFNECIYSELTIISCAIRSLRLYLYHCQCSNCYEGWLGLWAPVSGLRFTGAVFPDGHQFDSWTWTLFKLHNYWTRVGLNLLFLVTPAGHYVCYM